MVFTWFRNAMNDSTSLYIYLCQFGEAYHGRLGLWPLPSVMDRDASSAGRQGRVEDEFERRKKVHRFTMVHPNYFSFIHASAWAFSQELFS